MFCPSCGATAQEGQRFCTSCGASLALVSVAPLPPRPADTIAAPPAAAVTPPTVPVIVPPVAPVGTVELSDPTPPAWSWQDTDQQPPAPPPHRLDTRLAIAGGLTAGCALLALVVPLFRMRTDPAELLSLDGSLHDLDNSWIVVITGVLVLAAGLWLTTRDRPVGRGLAGGAGLSLAALALVPLALTISVFDISVQSLPTPVDITVRQTYHVGFFLLIATVAGGLATFVLSLGDPQHADQWSMPPAVAAVGMCGAVLALAGPLLPSGGASFADNFSSDTVPPATLLLRLAALALVAAGGVLGCIDARRWGSALAAGAMVVPLAQVATTLGATDSSDNLEFGVFRLGGDASPHVLTVVGLLLVSAAAVFGLVASSTKERR